MLLLQVRPMKRPSANNIDIISKAQLMQERMRTATIHYGRKINAVQLLAVSKGQTTQNIIMAMQAGIYNFGENYIQEALPKIQALKKYPICWHFIGPIQSNKTHDIARHFTQVHSIDRQKIAQQLNDFRPPSLVPLRVCIQVNLDNEPSKAGVAPADIAKLALFIQSLPNLQLTGLMAIPQQLNDANEQYKSFCKLADLLVVLNQRLGLDLTTLSMGMSSDWEAAIHAGSTIIRIGTAIFGERR